MDVLEVERGSYSETCVMGYDNGTEEVCSQVEPSIGIKEGIAEPITSPPKETEQVVSLWGECEVVAAYALRHLWPKKGNCEVILNYLLFVLYCLCHILFGI
jgi:hypothetical protein